MIIIDAHTHLWKKQNGYHNGQPVYALSGGKSAFAGEVRQMMPPYLLNGENTAELLLSNMDYACVSGAVVTQEVMDGNQNDYLLSVKEKYPDRLRICGYYDDNSPIVTEGFDGIKLCACKLREQDLLQHFAVFEAAAKEDLFISIDMADGEAQVPALREIIQQLPDLRIAIGHFGMVTREGWTEQIRLARYPNVRIESGGITWLFNEEFYPYPSAIRAIREAAEICGYEKLMWGSDYPRTMVEITYKMSYDFIMKSKEISEENKAMFLGENAQCFYHFSPFEEMKPIPHML